MREWVSINGELFAADQARVSVFDSGFMQGVGLFETMRAYRGRVFRLERHLDRLRASAAALGWTVVPDEEDLRSQVMSVVGATEAEEARVRLTVTTGSLRATAPDTPALTIVASAVPGEKYPAELYTRGVTALISSYRQSRSDPTAGHKTTSYFGRLAGLREAHNAGAFEAIWLNDEGNIAEGSISSVFMVAGDGLHTPPLDTPVLPGIARATVIELAAAAGVSLQERAITVDELRAADELFLTNSLMEIMPVVRIARDAVGTEKPGELTRQLAEAYSRQIERECADG